MTTQPAPSTDSHDPHSHDPGGPDGPGRAVVAAGHPPAGVPMIARTPEDLLAAVPVVLGFHPSESLVMICSGPRRPGERHFHARVDLPPPHRVGQMDGAVQPLRQAVRDHGVEQVSFVVYTAHRRVAQAASRGLEAAFADVGLHGVLRVHDGTWSVLSDGREGPSHAHDPAAHAFATQAVVAGAVIHRDRAALAASIARDPTGAAEVAATLMALPPYPAAGPPAAEVAWAVELVAGASGERPPDAEQVARVARLVAHAGPRDEVWRRLTRTRAGDLVPWWSDVVRRTPDPLLADAAFLLAFTAWLSGHGALAWCALDRVLAVSPRHSAARLLSGLLEGAVPPTDWEAVEGRMP